MMRIHLQSIFLFFGITTFLLLGIGILQWHKTLRKLSKERTTLLLSHPLPGQDRYCNPERLPEGLSRLFNLYDEVKTFVTFIGYSQDMDSLAGAMLDAHPEILIPQKYDIIGNWKMFQGKHLQELGLQKYMLFFLLQYLSRFQALFRNQARTPRHFWLWTFKGDGINYNFVPGAWQGTTDGKLKVIGDSSGVITSKKLRDSHGNFLVLEEMQALVGIPVKFVHVITNPFDSIASSVIGQPPSGIKINDSNAVNSAIKTFFALLESNEQIRKIYGNAVLDVYGYNLVFKRSETLKQICIFLDVQCDDNYLKTVGNIFSEVTPSRPRDLVEWRMEDKDRIHNEMKKFAFLQPFSFNSD